MIAREDHIRSNVLQVVGYKNSGKTTLISRMVGHLVTLGYLVGTVKHDAHSFEMDLPGTDTWQHRQSGASKVFITSPDLTAKLENKGTPLEHLLSDMSDMDFVLAEGFKQAPYSKFVIIRNREDTVLLTSVSAISAVITWIPLNYDQAPVIGIEDTGRILERMMDHFGIKQGRGDIRER